MGATAVTWVILLCGSDSHTVVTTLTMPSPPWFIFILSKIKLLSYALGSSAHCFHLLYDFTSEPRRKVRRWQCPPWVDANPSCTEAHSPGDKGRPGSSPCSFILDCVVCLEDKSPDYVILTKWNSVFVFSANSHCWASRVEYKVFLWSLSLFNLLSAHSESVLE